MKKKRGFTLIEVSIVAALFAVAGAALLATLSSGISIWERMYAEDTPQALSIFFDELSRDIHNSARSAKMPFAADKRGVEFTSYIHTKSEWCGLSSGAGRIRYWWDDGEKTLFKEEKNMSHVYKGAEGEKTKLLEGVQSFSVRFYVFDKEYHTFQWKDAWSPEAESGPLALSVRVVVGDEENRVPFERTVWVPVNMP